MREFFGRLVGFGTLRSRRAGSAGLAGLAGLALPLGRSEPQVLFWAVVPGFLGAVGAVLMVGRCIRQAEREREEALEAAAGLAPLALETLPT